MTTKKQKHDLITERLCSDPKYQLLIKNLYVRQMNLSDMLELFRVDNTTSNRQTFARMIQTIGNKYPVYEPIPAHYKILTDNDLEEYRDLYRMQKHEREEKKICRMK